MWNTKIAPGGYLMLEVPPNRTSQSMHIFIKPDHADGGMGQMLTLGIEAPMEVRIVREPTESEKRLYPDRGVSVGKDLAKVSRWEKEQAEKREAAKKPKDPPTQRESSGSRASA